MNSTLCELKSPPEWIPVQYSGLFERLYDQWRPIFPNVHLDRNLPRWPGHVDYCDGHLQTRTLNDPTTGKPSWWLPVVLPLEEEFYTQRNGAILVPIDIGEVNERVRKVYEVGLLKRRFKLGEINWPIRSAALTAYCHCWVLVYQ